MTDSKQTSRKPIIVCAANQYIEPKQDINVLVTGARHFDDVMYKSLFQMFPDDGIRRMICSRMEQGFIDQYGKFYNRQDALKIVKENGQPFDAERNSGNGKDLYSEGLY